MVLAEKYVPIQTEWSENSKTVLIPIENAGFYGRDTNGLFKYAQILKKSTHELYKLAYKMINPAMIEAVRRIVHMNEEPVRVCLYVKRFRMKDTLLTDDFVSTDGYHIRPTMTLDDYRKIHIGHPDRYMLIERLIIYRDVVCECVGVKGIDVVMTFSKHTSVESFCSNILRPPSNPLKATLYEVKARRSNAIRVPAFKTVSTASAEQVMQIIGNGPVLDRDVSKLRRDQLSTYCCAKYDGSTGMFKIEIDCEDAPERIKWALPPTKE